MILSAIQRFQNSETSSPSKFQTLIKEGRLVARTSLQAAVDTADMASRLIAPAVVLEILTALLEISQGGSISCRGFAIQWE